MMIPFSSSETTMELLVTMVVISLTRVVCLFGLLLSVGQSIVLVVVVSVFSGLRNSGLINYRGVTDRQRGVRWMDI